MEIGEPAKKKKKKAQKTDLVTSVDAESGNYLLVVDFCCNLGTKGGNSKNYTVAESEFVFHSRRDKRAN